MEQVEKSKDMIVIKRDSKRVKFKVDKILAALEKAAKESKEDINILSLKGIIEKTIKEKYNGAGIHVDEIQDIVEHTLMKEGYTKTAKAYIIYRNKRDESRAILKDISNTFDSVELAKTIKKMLNYSLHNKKSRAYGYNPDKLKGKYLTFITPKMKDIQKIDMLVRAAAELTSKEEPHWEYVSGNLYLIYLEEKIKEGNNPLGLLAINLDKNSYPDYVDSMVLHKYYGAYLTDAYTEEELKEAYGFIDYDRDLLFNYSGIDLFSKRYLIRSREQDIIETPQLAFLGIALHLMKDEDKDKRLDYVKRYYDVLSTLKLTVATPTLSNARTPFHQLSSCFIETVEDSLDGIFRATTNFAQVSKHGGGMGMYLGHIRANGSAIRGFEGAAGGVIPWTRIINDVAVAVDQLGVRQGAVAATLDVWHKDVPEFLQIRTNNGDDRMKAHDVFPVISYPDYFWELVDKDMQSPWYLLDPHEVETKMGYRLEDFYGEEWTKRYKEIIANEEISKREMRVVDIIRLVVTSLIETGTPFTVYRDTANIMNPNKHAGMIYSSNLCQEIFMNQSASTRWGYDYLSNERVVEVTDSGDFPVCNLASLTLGNINVDDEKELEEVITIAIRGLDNVITQNLYPTPYAKISNLKYRSVGLGTSGYHHLLAKNGIYYSSDEHLEYMDKLYEKISYYAIKASNNLAKEKGTYLAYEGSEWQTGKYFERRNYTSDRWMELKDEVAKTGMRNGWLMAVAPTGSTSIISGTSAGVDPIMSRYFLEEKKGSMVPRVAPELTNRSFWTYENAHEIDQMWTIKATGIRQRHIDQGQSVNMYVSSEMTMSQLKDLLLEGWRNGLKSIYYFRSKSLEVEECDTCSA